MVDVLIVESGEMGELLVSLCETYNLNARLAQTAELALEIALRDDPRLMVVQVELAGGGLDLAELIHSELEIPVLLTYQPSTIVGAQGAALQERIEALDGSFKSPFRSLALIERCAELLGVALPKVASEPDGEDAPSTSLPLEDHGEIFVDVDLEMDSVDFDDAANENDSSQVAVEKRATRDLKEVVADTDAPGPDLPTVFETMRQQLDASSNVSAPSADGAPIVEDGFAYRSGALTPRALGNVLDAFHKSRSSGEIYLVRGKARRLILLHGGAIVGVRTNLPLEQLPAIIARRGDLEKEQLQELAKQGPNLAVTIANQKRLGPKRLRALLDEQVRRVVLGAFAWRDGSYRITFDGHGAHELFSIKVSVGDALVRSIVLTESLEALRVAAPDDARFAPYGDATYGLSDVTLGAKEARFVIAMDGTKTMSDLETLFDDVEERTRRGLAAGLFRVGVLRFAGWGPSAPRAISFF